MRGVRQQRLLRADQRFDTAGRAIEAGCEARDFIAAFDRYARR